MRIKLGWLLLVIGVIAVLGYTFIGFYQDVEKYGFLKVVFDLRFSLNKMPHPISSVVWITIIWISLLLLLLISFVYIHRALTYEIVIGEDDNDDKSH